MTDRAESEDEPPEEAATSALQIGPSLIEEALERRPHLEQRPVHGEVLG